MDLERFVCKTILEAAKWQMSKLPLCWFGTYNALALYCDHPSYSPFLPLPQYCGKEERRKNIDELINRKPPHIKFTNKDGGE